MNSVSDQLSEVVDEAANSLPVDDIRGTQEQSDLRQILKKACLLYISKFQSKSISFLALNLW